MATAHDPKTPPANVDKLREVHADLAARARADFEPARFFHDFLSQTVASLGGASGAVWLVEPPADRRGSVTLAAELRIPTEARTAHQRLAADVVTEGAGRCVPVDGRSVMSYPIRVGTTVLGVVSIGFATEPSREAQQQLQRTLVPLCDHAADYLFGRSGANTNTAPPQVAEFALEVHSQLDLRRTASAIANETRRLTDSDRASVCIYRRRRAEAVAVSGQDYLDRRANLVRRLEALAAAVAAGGESLRFPHDDDEAQLAPQVEAALNAYLDESQARQLTVEPLRAGPAATDEIIGILTVEKIATAAPTKPSPIPQPHGPLAGRRSRDASEAASSEVHLRSIRTVDEFVPHAAAALANALLYDSVPFRRLTRPVATIDALTGGSRLKKRLLLVGLLVGLVAALWLVPYDFAVEARGTLQPAHRRDVFASADGIVSTIFVRHGDKVVVGDPLFELRSTELEVAEADLIKAINETEQEFANAERQHKDGRGLTPLELQRLVGQIATLEQRRQSLRRQASLFTEKRKRLRIESPIDGQVATWNIEELLAERPVRQGQTLIGLVDPAGDWEVEVRVPEDRFGHVAEKLNAKSSDGEKLPLKITFVLATDPGHEYEGEVTEAHLAAEPRGEEGNVVLVRAKIEKEKLAQLHPGADVRVRVECGSRALGYVLLHDVWSFVQSRVLFKL